MTKRRANKAERDHMGRVAELGCLICRRPAQVHHVRGGGMGRKSSNYDTFPLCFHHHTGAEGIHTIGIMTWEDRYGSELAMLTETKRLLA